MGVTILELVRPVVREIDRMLVQLRDIDADLADDLTMLRDLAVRATRWHLDKRARDERRASIKRLVDVMRTQQRVVSESEWCCDA